MSSKFSTNIKDFGYTFNDAGQLRKIDPKTNSATDLPFQFQDQVHYDALGEAINEHVYQMLIDIGLKKIYIPSPKTETSSFVFGTKNDFKDTKKLLFLIHGSGVVRAGQWSRKLIINHSLNHGTQIPYIKRAIEMGNDVLITNTNHNSCIENGKRIVFQGSESPEKHIVSVWEQLIAPALDTIQSFAVIGHSYGSNIVQKMVSRYERTFEKKCFAIVFTDSVIDSANKMDNKLRRRSRNFVTSSEPLNTNLNSSSSSGVALYSSGHVKHEWTSWACIDAVFPFLEKKYVEFLGSIVKREEL